MSWSTIEAAWNDHKAAAKEQWSRLTDEQITETQGSREQLSSRVQEAYALSREEAERQISDWQGRQLWKRAPAANS